jgi:hypothetical protein
MKAPLVLLVVFFFISSVYAQEADTTSMKKWHHPDHVKLHFAGEIGFLSPGVGIELFNKKQGELDLFGGFVPEGIGGDNLVTIALKFNYFPWKKAILKKAIQIEPLTLGLNIYHTFGEDINKFRDPDLYPKGYYWWTISTRYGPFFGGRLSKHYGPETFLKTITLYYELGTNDLFIYSWAGNRSTIPFYRIWNSSIGLKAVF